MRFHANAQICMQCKACYLNDLNRSITWTTPERQCEPNYSNM